MVWMLARIKTVMLLLQTKLEPTAMAMVVVKVFFDLHLSP
jgi:hypothetical protein